MTDLVFADSNLLIYAMDPNALRKRQISIALIREAIAQMRLVISPQILNGCYHVLAVRRKFLPPADAARYLRTYIRCCTAPLDAHTHLHAVDVAQKHRLSWWDSVALASAVQAGCRFFVSEDMQDGRTIEGVRIVDPFAPSAPTTLALT